MIELCTESSSDSSGRLDWTAVEKAFFPGATVELAAGGHPDCRMESQPGFSAQIQHMT